MAGIVSYGLYVPRMRLTAATKNWVSKVERTVCAFDEDTLTMAVAAGREALAGFDCRDIDAVLLASTSLPWAEKQSASLVATALDLRSDLFTVDVTGSLRSGTQALRMAVDGVRAGSWRTALVIVTDSRLATPGSDLEREGGDAAVAMVIGAEGIAIEVGWSYSIVNDLLDVWRGNGDRQLRATPEEHFRFEEGYLSTVIRCRDEALSASGITLKSFSKVAVSAPDRRRAAEANRRLGIDAAAAVERVPGIGSSGAADGFVQMISAIESAGASDDILLLNYGDGADALELRSTEALAGLRKSRPTFAERSARAIPVADYIDFLRWRGLWPGTTVGPRSAAAPHALYREQNETIRLHGMRCNGCGMVQYPAQRVCVKCQAKDDAEVVRMADGGGTLFSYSFDHVAGMLESPLMHGVIDFEQGGRAMMFVTERDLDAVAIGMRLDLTFRKWSEVDGITTYIWKATPAP